MVRSKWRRSAVGGAIVLVVLAGLAPVPVIATDNFNNNSLNLTLWLQRQFGGLTLAETNERLEFNANGATGVLSFAALEVRNWGAKWRYDFEIETRFRLNVNNINAEKEVALAIALALTGQIPDTFTGYGGVIIRDHVGLRLWIIRFSNGDEVEAQSIALGSIQGKLTLEYDRSDDRLEARVGNQAVHLDGIWSRFGATHGNDPMIIAIGCSTADGNISFPGTRVYLDEFEFTGVKKAR